VGVTSASGDFERGDLVRCVNAEGVEMARGLINYGWEDTQKLLGRSSIDIERILGFGGEEELIHRDNLITVR
jgi:glutamate 5-kinase